MRFKSEDPVTPAKVMSRTIALRDIEQLDDARMRALHHAWSGIAEKGPPRAADFPSGFLEPMLPNLALVELTAAGPIYRFFGPTLVRLLGRDPTGFTIEAVYPDAIAREVMNAIVSVRDDKCPRLDAREFRILACEIGYNRLLLPLFENGDDVSHVIVCIQPSSPHLRAASDWLRAVRSLQRHNEPLLNAQETWRRLQQANAGPGPELSPPRLWSVGGTSVAAPASGEG